MSTYIKIRKIKKISPDQMKRVREEFLKLEKYFDGMVRDCHDSRRKQEKENKKCPRCRKGNGSNVVEKIADTSGDIQGQTSGSFFLGCGEVSGSVKGKIETNGVLHCNNCGHEWKKLKHNIYVDECVIDAMFKDINDFFYKMHLVDHVEFDSQDPTEEFSSLSEKKEALLGEAQEILNKKSGHSHDLREFHAETIVRFIDKHDYNFSSWDSIFEKYENYQNASKIVKKLITWGCKSFSSSEDQDLDEQILDEQTSSEQIGVASNQVEQKLKLTKFEKGLSHLGLLIGVFTAWKVLYNIAMLVFIWFVLLFFEGEGEIEIKEVLEASVKDIFLLIPAFLFLLVVRFYPGLYEKKKKIKEEKKRCKAAIDTVAENATDENATDEVITKLTSDAIDDSIGIDNTDNV